MTPTGIAHPIPTIHIQQSLDPKLQRVYSIVENRLNEDERNHLKLLLSSGGLDSVIDATNLVKEELEKKRMTLTINGKETIVAEKIHKMLRGIDQYAKIVDTAISSKPDVAALVWSGLRFIIQV